MGKGGDIAATAPSPGLVATAAASEREDGGGERVGGWWRQSIGRRDVRGGWGWGRDLDVWSGREEGKQAAGFFHRAGFGGGQTRGFFSCGRQSNEGGRRETGRGRLAGKGKLRIFLGSRDD